MSTVVYVGMDVDKKKIVGSSRYSVVAVIPNVDDRRKPVQTVSTL